MRAIVAGMWNGSRRIRYLDAGDPDLPVINLPAGWIGLENGGACHADCARPAELVAWNAGLAWVELELALQLLDDEDELPPAA